MSPIINIQEAENGSDLKLGKVLLAPDSQRMKLARSAKGRVTATLIDDPKNKMDTIQQQTTP